jgi:hypothetical protein
VRRGRPPTNEATSKRPAASRITSDSGKVRPTERSMPVLATDVTAYPSGSRVTLAMGRSPECHVAVELRERCDVRPGRVSETGASCQGSKPGLGRPHATAADSWLITASGFATCSAWALARCWLAGVSGQASVLRKTPALSWVRRPVASWVRIRRRSLPTREAGPGWRVGWARSMVWGCARTKPGRTDMPRASDPVHNSNPRLTSELVRMGP